MAAPVVESDVGATGSGTSIVLSKPSGTTSGDLLLACIHGRTAYSTPADYTLLGTTNNSGNYIYVFWKVAGGSEPSSYTFDTTGSSTGYVANLARISGADTTSPESGVYQTAGDGQTGPAVTTADDDTLVFSLAGDSFTGNTPLTVPGDTTILINAAAGGNTTVGGVAYKSQTSSGNSGTFTWIDRELFGAKVFLTFAIAPAAGGGPVIPVFINHYRQQGVM